MATGSEEVPHPVVDALQVPGQVMQDRLRKDQVERLMRKLLTESERRPDPGCAYNYGWTAAAHAAGVARARTGVVRQAWWIPAAAAFVGLLTLFTFTGPYLVPDLHAPKARELRAEAARLARREGVAGVPLRIEDVHDWTDQPNAYAFGLGPSRRVVLWDTIARFPRREVRVVMAHEYGHLAHHHIAKGIGWFGLVVLPAALLVAIATRRRGGLGEPAAVPLALFVVVILQLATGPLQGAATRRYEAEADWSALRTARDPVAMRALFRHFTARALADPDPPGWFHVLFDDHPTGLQRIAMADAFARAQR